MDWLIKLFWGESVATSMVIITLVAAIGLALGNIMVRGVKLGVAGVLFSGILIGHLGLRADPHVLEFIREFGLILFVYTIGMQVGPGFFASLKRQGMPLNLMAAAVVGLGVLTTLLVGYLGKVDIPVLVGMYSGAVTNTPSLAAAQQALKDAPRYGEQMANLPSLGYAVAYPFGILGIILTMLLIRLIFKVNVAGEVEARQRAQREGEGEGFGTLNVVVQNPNLDGMMIQDIPLLADSGIVVSRVLSADVPQVARPETVLKVGDIILAVGDPQKLRQFQVIVGRVASQDLRDIPGPVTARRLLVTQKSVLGMSVAELQFPQRFGVTITRVSRADIEFGASPNVKLQYGDFLRVVGSEEGIARAAKEVGNSTSRLNHPEIVSVFVGVILGVILGSWPIHLPGIPAPVKLGLAGGPLLVAIFLSRIGRIGPLIWYMPISANFMLRELGISLFLSCVGLKAGSQFFRTLSSGPGFYWMGLAAIITFVPLMVVAVFMRVYRKENYVSLCGLLAGSMTDPPALAFATTATGSDGANVTYATVYPLTMFLRILSAQLMVILLM